jgi:hypothetical protein
MSGVARHKHLSVVTDTKPAAERFIPKEQEKGIAVVTHKIKVK